MRRAASAFVLVACACSADNAAPIRLDVPVRADHRAVLIAVERDNALAVRAQPITGGVIAPFVGELDDHTRVTVMLYTQTLAELRIAEGALAKEEGGRAIPAADLTLETLPIPGMMATWSEVQERSATLAAFRIEKGASPCGELTPETIDLGPAPARFALAVPGKGVLVGSDDGALRLFDPDRAATTLATPASFFDAILEPSGAIVFASRGGELWRGVLDAVAKTISLARTSTLGSSEDVLFIDGDPDGDLYAQTRDGTVFHFDGTRATPIARVAGRGRPTGIARVAPGVALSIWGDCLCVLRHRGLQMEEIAVPVNSVTSNGLSTLLHDPSYGTIAGSFIGEIIEATEDPASWMKIEGTYSTIQVSSLARYRDDYVYADKRGVVVQRVRDFGYCDPLPPERPTEYLGQVVVFGDDVVVASGVVTWWSPVRE